MSVDRGDAICIDGALQAKQFWPRSGSQKSSVERSDHGNLAVTGNAQAGNFCFFEPFAFKALDRIAPDFRDKHVSSDCGERQRVSENREQNYFDKPTLPEQNS